VFFSEHSVEVVWCC